MIRIEKAEVLGWEAAIRGMRNPMNSWDKSDSYYGMVEDPSPINPDDWAYIIIGENDLGLMKRLSKAGTDHRKFLRMIAVYVDLTAPLYWWKEFDTYKVGTVANSCSTMHKIHEKGFTANDFSCEQFLCGYDDDLKAHYKHFCLQIDSLNNLRDLFLKTKNKKYWYAMIQMLPSSYNQKRTVMLNYEVLANIYKSRKNHKLDEWRAFCAWIESLPYSELITGGAA